MRARRFCAPALALALIIVLALPVSASELYNPWTDILDLSTVNDAGTNYFAFNTSTSINIDAGYESIVSYIDMVWYCGYGAPDSIYLWRNAKESGRLALTIQRIGTSNFYRVFGNVGGYTMRDFKFDITSTTAYSGTTTYRSYEIRSCRIAGSIATYDLNMSYSISPEADAAYSRNAVYEPTVDIEYGVPMPYTLEISPDDWALYDYLDIFINTQSATIDSVVVEHNGRAIPFTTTDHGTSFAGQINQEIYSSAIFGDTYMMLNIDLTTIQHSSNVTPTITISGFYNNGQWASIGWQSAIGYVRDAERGGVLHWFNLAKEFLIGLFDGDTTESDAYQEEAGQQRDELDGMNEQLQNVNKPGVDSIKMDVSNYLPASDSQSYAVALSGLTQNDLIVSMMCITLTIALVGYVLYGKR